MSSYRVITTHLDPQDAMRPAPIAVMFFDDPERGWEQMLPASCLIAPERARGLARDLLWLADAAEGRAREPIQ